MIINGNLFFTVLKLFNTYYNWFNHRMRENQKPRILTVLKFIIQNTLINPIIFPFVNLNLHEKSQRILNSIKFTNIHTNRKCT